MSQREQISQNWTKGLEVIFAFSSLWWGVKHFVNFDSWSDSYISWAAEGFNLPAAADDGLMFREDFICQKDALQIGWFNSHWKTFQLYINTHRATMFQFQKEKNEMQVYGWDILLWYFKDW